MNNSDFYFNSKDNLKLHGQQWRVDKPIAIICMIHGLGEHIGRYSHVAEAFNKKQISFYGFDLRGHGNSEGKKGHTPSIQHMFDDIEQLLVRIRKEFPDTPIIIYGHSLGGNLALNYLLHRNSNEIAFGVITSPWLKLTNKPTAFQLLLAKFGSRFIPSLAQPNGLNIKDISSVQKEQDTYANDPLIHNKITGRLYMEINSMGEKAITIATSLKTPILLSHGTNDNITSPIATEEFAKSIANDFIHLKLWNKLRHETHNEYNKEEVITYYVDWVLAKLKEK